MSVLSMIVGRGLLPIAIPFILYHLYRSYFFKKHYLPLLRGKIVLITGASSGLGESLAHAFYKSGCKVILAARRLNELERVKSDLLKIKMDLESYEPCILQLDLLDVDSMAIKALEAKSFFGDVDILLNNGGISSRGFVKETSVSTYIYLMTVNYFGPLALTKEPMIKNGGGHIIGISSVQGKIAIPERSAYSASKHAFHAFLDSLRSEVAENNIKVTTVNPGYIKTNLSLNAITGSGEPYGVNDQSTQAGYHPDMVAHKILAAVAEGTKEITICTIGPKIAILLRALLPDIYFNIMAKRAKKK